MSEFPYQSKKTPHNFSSLLLSDFHLFCSFVLSHPLYFSYFIFFSPYLIKLLSFLSPLFITTSLLILLVLFTVSPDLVSDSSTSHPDWTESKVSFLLSVYQTIVDKLRSEVDNEDQELYCFEELEVYKIVFETSVTENRANPVEVLEVEAKECPPANSEAQSDQYFDPEGFDGNLDENSVEYTESLRGLLNQKEESDDLLDKKQEKEVKPLSKAEETSIIRGSNGVVGNKIISEAKVNVNSGEDYVNSAKLGADLWCINGNYSPKVMENSEMNLGSFGSMRKEKEWRRTLAGKLFEERHNVDGSGGDEGMDMLWETYEATDSTKVKTKSDKKKISNKGRSIKECCEDEEGEDYDDGDYDDDEQLCCLQALKFSAGKMNLGMGRPNLVKISKAFKGFGWLHHVTKIRKKGYH